MALVVVPPDRYLVGSTAGRGPCRDCGAVAELHQVELRAGSRIGFIDGLCLTCAARPQLPVVLREAA